MKMLIFLALAALASAEAEPEADPLLLIKAPISPIVSLKTEELKPITYTVSSALPYAGVPFTGTPLMYPVNPLITLATAEEAAVSTEETARAKREADPQVFINPLVSVRAEDTALPLTYSFPAVSSIPSISAITYKAGSWPYQSLPIAYTLAKKTE